MIVRLNNTLDRLAAMGVYKISLLFCLFIFLSGCGDSDACSSDADCFLGQVCRTDQCVDNTSQNNTSQNNGNQNNTEQNNTQNNSEQNSTNQNNSSQNNTNQNNTNNQNSGSNNGENNPHGCYIDPFTTQPCDDDGNDPVGREVPGLGRGCETDDNFQPSSVTVDSRLCSNERADKYWHPLSACRQTSFVVEVVFTPAKVCTGEYNLSIGAQFKSCERQDESDDVQCMEQDDGTIVAQFIIQPSGAHVALSIDIDKGDTNKPDVAFDYQLEVNLK